MTHYCCLRIIYNKQEDLQEFYIMNLGKDHLILGYPFLQTFNPRVDWRKGRLLGGTVKIQSSMYKHLDRMVTRWQIKALQSLGRPKEGEAIYVRRMTISQEMARQYHQREAIQLHKVPKEYQRYKEVFSEEAAKRFPPDRNPNATVELLPGAPEQLDCKVHPLTKPETEILKKFLAEELEKGFIEEAASPYTSPVFFINKKNSMDKWLIISY
jgi:hypothetical protein